MFFERVHYLPILISAWFPITFTITYTIAVSNDHVSPLFPTISDTGTFSPESCMFGQMLNLGAVMMAACCYIRYLQIQEINENNCSPDFVGKLNWYSLIMALLASAGISIVGNFEETNAPFIHCVGAFLAFGVGWIYFSLQTYISFQIYPSLGSKRMMWFRAVLSIGVISFFIMLVVFGAAAYYCGVSDDVLQKVSLGIPGTMLHFISPLSEWILTTCEILFIASLAQDFKYISLTLPSISNKLK